jgi:hypothetical protein
MREPRDIALSDGQAKLSRSMSLGAQRLNCAARFFGFGFRPGRSAHDAVKTVQDYIRKGYRFAVDMD